MQRRGYVPALDGLRALAVLSVLVYHTWNILPGGWVGVDVFFVLSGYLITAILLDERGRTGTISLGQFYLRRALRLLPALALCVTMAVALAETQGPGLTDVTTKEAAAAALYVANWWQVVTPHAPLGLLAHTWSLSIEEQFYLVWPALLWGLLALRGHRAVLCAALAGTALVLVHRLMLVKSMSLPFLTYYRTDTRADTLLIGAALAALAARGMLARIPGWALRLAAAAGIGGLGAVSVRFGVAPLDGTGFTLVALAAAAVVAAVVAPHGWPLLHRALSWRPLVAVGRVSYGVYLFHIVIWQGLLAPHISRGPLAALLTTVLTLAVAAGSYRYVETPFLRMKNRIGVRRRRAALEGAATA
jgi:peptidoglycan/LPS O-acetylase OafA/YrhL